VGWALLFLALDEAGVVLEGADRGDSAGQAELLPAFAHLIVNLLAQRRTLGENGEVAVVLAGIDERLRPVGALLRRVLRRVEPRAPLLRKFGCGAGEGNRTLVCSLGSCRSAIELHPLAADFTATVFGKCKPPFFAVCYLPQRSFPP
jgi:hypothetical protein